MKLSNEQLTIQSSNAADVGQLVVLVGSGTETVTLNGTTPATTTKLFTEITSATLSATTLGTVTVKRQDGATVIELRPGETVRPADVVQPGVTPVRNPPKALEGEPGLDFGSGNLNDFTWTERHTAESHDQPLPFGTPHPTNSRLLLIGQKLTETESNKRIHVRVYAARLAAQDQAGYGYTVSYPYATKDYPKVQWDIRIAKTDYTGMAFAQSCLIDGYTGLELVDENFKVDAIGVFGTLTLGYEKVPGLEIHSEGYDERGDLETTKKQTVANNDDPPVETMGYLYNAAEKTGVDALRATRLTKTVESRTALWTEEAFTTNRTLDRHLTGTFRTTKDEIVPVGTEAETGFLVVESSVKDKNKWQAEKRTTKVDSFVQLVSGEVDPAAHGATTTTAETIVESGTAPTAGGLDVLESSVEDLDGTHALRKVKQLATGESWPVLESDRIDPVAGIVVHEKKEVIAPGAGTPGVDGNRAISSITVPVGGSGYLTTPSVTISDLEGNGTGAVATPTMTTPDGGTVGSLESIQVTAGGHGFTSAPSVTIDAPPTGGTHVTATATAVLAATTDTLGSVTGIEVATQGSYTAAPTLVIDLPTEPITSGPLNVELGMFTGPGDAFMVTTSSPHGMQVNSTFEFTAYSTWIEVRTLCTIQLNHPYYVITVVSDTEFIFSDSLGGEAFNPVEGTDDSGTTTIQPLTRVLGEHATASVAFTAPAFTLGTSFNPGQNYATMPTPTVSGGGAFAVSLTPNQTNSSCTFRVDDPGGYWTRILNGNRHVVGSYYSGAYGPNVYATVVNDPLDSTGHGASVTLTADADGTIAIVSSTGGSGYTYPPTVQITDPGGSGTFILYVGTDGGIDNIGILGESTGWGPVVQVFFGGNGEGVGNGTGAKAVAIITNGIITGFDITARGSGYIQGSSVVAVIPQTGSGAIITVLVTPPVWELAITNQGTVGLPVPTITFPPPQPMVLAYTPTSGELKSVGPQPGFPGGYPHKLSIGDRFTLSLSQSGSSTGTVLDESTVYRVIWVDFLSLSGNYTGTYIGGSHPAYSLRFCVDSDTSSTPVTTTSTAVWDIVPVQTSLTASATVSIIPSHFSATITNAGSGYTSPPAVTVVRDSSDSTGDTTGNVAILSTTIETTSIDHIDIVNPGSGYTSVPDVVFSGGGGTGAVATAVPYSMSVASISLVSGHAGHGYAKPVVTISNPDMPHGILAMAIAHVVSGFIEVQSVDKWRSIQITSSVNPALLPAPETWNASIRQAFPAVLKDQYFMLFVNNQDMDFPGGLVAMVPPYRLDMQEAFSAACDATVTRTYWHGPPATVEKQTKFLPQSHDLIATFDDSTTFSSAKPAIPSCLHGPLHARYCVSLRQAITQKRPAPIPVIYDDIDKAQSAAVLLVGGNFLSDDYSTLISAYPFMIGNIPATSPDPTSRAQWNPGVSTFIAHVNVEKWKLGIWIKEVYTATLPKNPALS